MMSRGSRDPLLEFWDPGNGTTRSYIENMQNRSKSHVTQFWNLGTLSSLYISGMVETRNFKLEMEKVKVG